MTRKLARVFPATHPKKGQPTHFVEKFLVAITGKPMTRLHFYEYIDKLVRLNPDKDFNIISDFAKSLDWTVDVAKIHTIRLGNSIKDGQMLQLAVWSGKPYNSPEIKIWEPVKVGIKDIETEGGIVWYRDENSPHGIRYLNTAILAKNDGLLLDDFQNWFRKASGPAQIIHWTELRY
jgi:hypothetical protein